MWFFVSGAVAGPAVGIQTTDWPADAQKGIHASVAKCAPRAMEGGFTISVSGSAPDRSVDFSSMFEAVEGIGPCVREALLADAALKASEDAWSADVTLSLDPTLLAAVTLPPDAPGRLVDWEGKKLEDPVATAGLLRSSIAKCSAEHPFHGAIELYDPFSRKGEPSTSWRSSPRTPAGEAVITCARSTLQDAAQQVEVLGSLVVGVQSGTPTRGKIAVTSADAPPAVLARVKGVAEQCHALHPITAPYSRSFQPEGSNVLGMTVSMAEGQAMPSDEHSACVELFPSDFPPKSALTFTFSPG